VLIKFDPACITKVSDQDYKNIDFARYIVNHKGTITIDNWHGEIIIEGYQLQIEVDADQKNAFVVDEDKKEVRIDAACDEIDIAIQDGDKDLVRKLMLELEEECIVNPKPEVLESLERQKNLLRNGAKINLAKVAVIIKISINTTLP